MIIVTTKSIGNNNSNDNDNCFHYSEPKHKRVAGGGGGGGGCDGCERTRPEKIVPFIFVPQNIKP